MKTDKITDSVGKQESVLKKEIWNAAIEAAALKIPKYKDDDMNDIRDEVRKLKK